MGATEEAARTGRDLLKVGGPLALFFGMLLVATLWAGKELLYDHLQAAREERAAMAATARAIEAMTAQLGRCCPMASR